MTRSRTALLSLLGVAALAPASAALADGTSDGNGDGKTTICHATGSATNPFVLITVSNNALAAHRRHQNGEDIIPAPSFHGKKFCPKKKHW